MALTAAMSGDGEKRSNIKTIKRQGESLESEKKEIYFLFFSVWFKVFFSPDARWCCTT
jgi:hypothetical protein